jgi:hypothetical protein
MTFAGDVLLMLYWYDVEICPTCYDVYDVVVTGVVLPCVIVILLHCCGCSDILILCIVMSLICTFVDICLTSYL